MTKENFKRNIVTAGDVVDATSSVVDSRKSKPEVKTNTIVSHHV